MLFTLEFVEVFFFFLNLVCIEDFITTYLAIIFSSAFWKRFVHADL